MSQEDNVITIRYVKRNGILEPANSGMLAMQKAFVDALEDGQVVDALFEAYQDDGTNLQLAKIHLYIRKLASEMGYTFAEMKTVIKEKAGLIRGNHVKSLGDCSKDELGLVIEAIKEACEIVNVHYE